jgi:hypothetical protein
MDNKMLVHNFDGKRTAAKAQENRKRSRARECE